MTVKQGSVHKKKDVSSGETVDFATRGIVLFGVDSSGKAYPIDVSAGGVLNAASSTNLLNALESVLEKLESIELHLEKITEINQ